MAAILVTGASGYIGSYMCRWLRAQGHVVTASARTITPALAEAVEECRILTLDVLEIPDDLEGSWDCIVHTATANDILSRDFEAGIELSTFGTRNVLNLAKRLGVPHVLFFSTLQVYGTELKGEVSETSHLDLVNEYGLNHRFGELVCKLSSRQQGVRTSIMRPANVYGCPVSRTVDRWSLVPMCFVKEALESGTITLRSSGLQRRDFVSLRQVAAACEAVILERPETDRTYNIATGTTWSMLDAAGWVATAFIEAGLPAPELRVLGNEPKIPNDFRVHSAVTPPPTGGSSAIEMALEITKMLEFFRTHPQTI
jgi:nucleoside-diphosphate-sugar epimerase